MNSPGYTAIASGEVIHLIKCHPVPVIPRQDVDCTVEHPVYYRNDSYYITPRSHILQKTGAPIPCADILAPEYFIRDRWYRSQRGMAPTNNPITLSPKTPTKWAGLDLGNIMHADIYTSEQIERVRHQIMYPQERKAISEIFTSALNGDSVSHTTMLLKQLFCKSDGRYITVILLQLTSKYFLRLTDFKLTCFTINNSNKLHSSGSKLARVEPELTLHSVQCTNITMVTFDYPKSFA